MNPGRFKRTKSVMASSAIALVVAALAFGVSSSVLGTKSAIAQHLGFDLTSGTSSFTITSTHLSLALLLGLDGSPLPGDASLHGLQRPQQPDGDYLGPEHHLGPRHHGLPGTSRRLRRDQPGAPHLLGLSFNVPGDGDATSTGVPIELKDNGSPQDNCQTYTYHFTYSGSPTTPRSTARHGSGAPARTPRRRARASPTRPR